MINDKPLKMIMIYNNESLDVKDVYTGNSIAVHMSPHQVEHFVNKKDYDELEKRLHPHENGDITINDYEDVLKDHKRLVKEIDIILNGDNAAEQASLCDLVEQIRELVKIKNNTLELYVPTTHHCDDSPDGCCHYDAEDGIVTLARGEIYTLSQQERDDFYIDESGNYHDDDCCLFCGLPYERK